MEHAAQCSAHGSASILLAGWIHRRHLFLVFSMQVYCWVILGHGLLYFVLFANFYIKSYLTRSKPAKNTKMKVEANGVEKKDGDLKTNIVEANKTRKKME